MCGNGRPQASGPAEAPTARSALHSITAFRPRKCVGIPLWRVSYGNVIGKQRIRVRSSPSQRLPRRLRRPSGARLRQVNRKAPEEPAATMNFHSPTECPSLPSPHVHRLLKSGSVKTNIRSIKPLVDGAQFFAKALGRGVVFVVNAFGFVPYPRLRPLRMMTSSS